MARVVILDTIVFEPIAVVDVADSFLTAVAKRATPNTLKLMPDDSLTLRFEIMSTVTGRFFWTASATAASGTLTLRDAFLVQSQEFVAHRIKEALGSLVR